MPTGYTAELDKNDVSFERFAMGCARAFGALIMMRDDPQGAPIPESFKPDEYHLKQKHEAEQKVERLSAMSAGERYAYGAKAIADQRKMYLELSESIRAANERFTTMMDRVRAWNPPTSEHHNFKKFMLDQLKISMSDTVYYDTAIAEIAKESPAARFDRDLAKAREDIAYHEQHHAEEVARTNGRNTWLRQLRDSLAQRQGDGTR